MIVLVGVLACSWDLSGCVVTMHTEAERGSHGFPV